MNNQSVSISDVTNWWSQHHSSGRDITAEVAIGQGDNALQAGHPTLAYDIFKEALTHYANNAQLIYRAALSLARGGNISLAEHTLQPLIDEQAEDILLSVDVLSLAGRLAKDRWSRLDDRQLQRSAANKSADFYSRAFALSGDYFPAINAASMNMIAGNSGTARTLAENVLSICRASADVDNDHWLSASMAEACLLLDDQNEAVTCYAKAVLGAAHSHGDIASMRRQVLFLSRVMQVDPRVLQALRVPRVVAFSGHMIDAASRPKARFPAAIERSVYDSIAHALQQVDAGIAYASAACGADILFIEAMLDRGAEVHVVLPFGNDEFIRTSVAFAGQGWVRRFFSAMSRVTSVRYASRENYLNDDILFKYTADQVTGLSILHAQRLESAPLFLSAIDQESTFDVGGTHDNAERWQTLPYEKLIIDIGELRERHFAAPLQPAKVARTTTTQSKEHCEPATVGNKLPRRIQTMLFADVVGFSKLNEESAPAFFVNFLGKMAQVIHGHGQQPVFCNTWGDGLFMVFDEVHVAADFALRIRDMILATDWQAEGMPQDTSIRIGMHAGPVFKAEDPIIQQTNFYGAHVNRAARIEPVTAPGAVFMSEQTACLLIATGHDEFSCDYLGSRDLAKKFGADVLYRLRRSRDIE
ncbi:MAG: class 3 adenylate cyclase [Gammaproteobacteria bacterium]|jgi:class 3 adenylate cyclase